MLERKERNYRDKDRIKDNFGSIGECLRQRGKQ